MPHDVHLIGSVPLTMCLLSPGPLHTDGVGGRRNGWRPRAATLYDTPPAMIETFKKLVPNLR
jgi:hypothetical protein